MMPRLIASLVAPALFGLLAIGCAWWRSGGVVRFGPWLGFLALGIGLGLSSSVFFVWLSLVGASGARFPLGELGLLVLLAGAALYARKLRPARSPLPTGSGSAVAPKQHPLLSLALWLSAGCATIAFVVRSVTNPQGGWDAWMTWNMHARAIFRGGEQWREVLTGLPDWSHPDYPLLVPASVARMWTYIGQETPLAPASVALLFTLATVGLLYSSVSTLRSRTQGCLAALLLLGTKFFVLHGASQYADVPFGFFLLATLVLLALTEVWPDDRACLVGLAGLTVGLAAWTKNEGLLLLLAVLVSYGLVMVRARGWHTGPRDARAFAIGLAPVLMMIVCFKIWVAPPNDLLSDQGLRETAERLLEGTRYSQILAGLGQGFLEISPKGAVGLLLLAYWFCAGPAEAGPARPGAKTAALVVALMLAGYISVLLAAPSPLLATNIRSINRLLLQLWPSTLFAYFLAVRSAEEAGVFGPRLQQTEAARRHSSGSTFQSEAA